MIQQRARDLLAMIEIKEPNELVVNSWWGNFVKDYKDALQTAIKALEQQPYDNNWRFYYDHGYAQAKRDLSCEDCISRQAVLNKLNRLIEVERLQGTDEMGYGRERISAYESMIFEINSKYLYPSVNPQEPCENCISREAVLDALHLEGRPTKRFDYFIAVKSDIIALPPVTPKEKTGHWIDEADDIDAQFDRHEYKCSVCGRIANYYVGGNECWWDIYKPNFCPNCGAKMVEPQESEGKEGKNE